MFEYGGKNGRLLAWLAKSQNPTIHTASVRDAASRLLVAPDFINQRFMQFIQELYESRVAYSTTELAAFLDLVKLPVLGETDRERLEADITLEEIQVAIGSLQAGKTSGSDGLPVEFYSNFTEIVVEKPFL